MNIEAISASESATVSLLTLAEGECFSKSCSCERHYTLETWMKLEDRKPWLLKIEDEGVLVILAQGGCPCLSHMVVELGEVSL